jgi:hypothetical protein
MRGWSGSDSFIQLIQQPVKLDIAGSIRQRRRQYLEPALRKTYAEFVILAISLLIGFGVSAFSMAVALVIFSVVSDLDR